MGVNKVLELIGTRAWKGSLKCIGTKRMICITGILGSEWTMKEFIPMGDFPLLVRLKVYIGESKNLSKEVFQEFIDDIERGNIKLKIDKVCRLDEVAKAPQDLEDNKPKGRLVVKIKKIARPMHQKNCGLGIISKLFRKLYFFLPALNIFKTLIC